MNDESELQRQDKTSCPKRVWVMMTLSDDEALPEDGTLPHGLRFHLSRCESCRAVADRLLAVSGTLRSLSSMDPDDDLAERADSQALGALREGAELTGRISIPDEPEPVNHTTGRVKWHRYARYAAAAVVLIAFGLFGLSSLRGPQGPRVARQVESDLPSVSLPDAAFRPSGSSDPDVQPDERVADAGPAQLAVDEPKRERRSRRPCRYRSHIEAAACDDTYCIHRAVIVPHRRSPLPDAANKFGLVWTAFRAFDISSSSGSTAPRQDDE